MISKEKFLEQATVEHLNLFLDGDTLLKKNYGAGTEWIPCMVLDISFQRTANYLLRSPNVYVVPVAKTLIKSV